MNSSKTTILAPLVSVLLSSCVAHQQGATPSYVSTNSLQEAYDQAVAKARYPDFTKISRDLVPLTQANRELNFNEQGQIQMATFTKAELYSSYQLGDGFPLFGDSWFTPTPFMQNFCRAYDGTDLLLRTQQLLGLPPRTLSAGANDSIVSIWIEPSELFRPCADPEVIDGECVVTLSGETFIDGNTSWGANTPQVSASFVNVERKHLNWMARNWNDRYSPPEGQAAYPWTALGYTYDWGAPTNPVGMSEFVGPKGTPVVFESILPLAKYCGR